MNDRIKDLENEALEAVLDEAQSRFTHAVSMWRRFCESPIEEAFGLALTVDMLCLGEQIFGEDVDILCAAPDRFAELKAKGHIGRYRRYAAMLVPQAVVGTYRVDFLVYITYNEERIAALAIECDGHEWHNVDKARATADRQRDRELTALGYRPLRFSGSELWRDPFKASHEICTLAAEIMVEFDPESHG